MLFFSENLPDFLRSPNICPKFITLSLYATKRMHLTELGHADALRRDKQSIRRSILLL